ncbi:MAG: hypothetical protein J5752_07265 [Clostridiales bacterium]|nr:hypothetical protein [Clostridiales bacterium]
MTRSFFKGVTIRALIAIVLAFGFLFTCYYRTENRSQAKEQAKYKEEFGTLLMAEEYRPLKTDILDNYQEIRYVYSAYDENGKLMGYILDVAMDLPDGSIHTQMSISENGENLMDIRILQDKDDSIMLDEEQMETLKGQLRGARIPVSVHQQIVDDVQYQVEYDPLLGLHDGVYYAELPEPAKDGYLDHVEIEVRGGRIVRVEWDAVNKTTGRLRSTDSIEGEYNISGNIWAEQAYRVQNRLVLVQDPMKLAMKSDGTTQIIDGVSMKITVFINLVNECIANSRASMTKDMYLRSKENGGEGSDEGDSETKETTAPAETTMDPASLDVTVTATPTPLPTEAPTPTPTKAPSQIGVIGGEDGVVQGDTGNILSESVDGIPLSEIRTYIDGLPDMKMHCSATLSTINLAYKFMREYLNWVG